MSSRELHLEACVVDLSRLEVRRGDERLTLTPLEASFLSHLHERADAAVSHEELLTAVWGYKPTTHTRAPSLLVARLRPKIERIPSKPRHLKTVRGHGYMLSLLRPEGGGEGAPMSLLTLARRAREDPVDEALRAELAQRAARIYDDAQSAEGDSAAELLLALVDHGLYRNEVEPLWRAAEEATQPLLKAQCAVHAVRLLAGRGHARAALRSVTHAFGLFGTGDTVDLLRCRCQLEIARANALGRLGRLDEAHKAARSAANIAERVGHIGLRTQAHDRLAFLARRRGDLAAAQQHHLDALDLLTLSPELPERIQVINNYATFLYDRGCYAEARVRYEQALSESLQRGLEYQAVALHNNLVSIALIELRLKDAEAEALATLAQATRLDSRQQIAMCLFNIARLRVEQGRHDQAGAELRRVLHISQQIGLLRLECHARVHLGWLAHVSGALTDAERAYTEAAGPCRDLGDHALIGLVSLWHAWLGGPQRRALLEEAERELVAEGSPLANFVGVTVTQPRRGAAYERRRCEALLNAINAINAINA